MMLIDPAGFRWLNETWLKVDRGVSFYNTAAIPFDWGFLISRAAFVVLGFGSVAWSRWHFAAVLRGTSRRVMKRRGGAAAAARSDHRGHQAGGCLLSSLGMAMRRPGLLAGRGTSRRSS